MTQTVPRMVAQAGPVRQPRCSNFFEGYASLFGRLDQAGDIVLPGAFGRSLRQRGIHGVRMLFQHDPLRPIGVWSDIREDARGLFVRGRLLGEVQQARELAALLQAGAIDGLSIGFKTRRARHDRKQGRRHLIEVDLWEISLVTFPMLPDARVQRLNASARLVSGPAIPPGLANAGGCERPGARRPLRDLAQVSNGLRRAALHIHP